MPLLAHDERASAVSRVADGASLVVVGSHRLSVIGRALFASVGRHVLERPIRPVAVVRSRSV
jgi:nucleotide-binding universal stress UspA family protein